MTPSELEKLAEAQREALQALAALTITLRVDQVTQPTGDAPARQDSQLQRTLEAASKAVSNLEQATSTNTQALAGLSRDLGGLPGLLAGLVGGIKDGSGGLSGILKTGLGLPGLISGIVGLFRGQPAAPAPLVPFIQPEKLALEVANTDDILGGFPPVDRDQSGQVRVEQQQPSAPVVVQPQITVNVSAMDSQSFLDRSDDIARAVRDAMLRMHPVNDFINEL
jgi:hypothetical protein